MSYLKTLGLEKEPFSTSPDPEFFFHSASHDTALKRLEISIRLRRGLNLILGDVGTGKTTCLRTLIQMFKDEDNFVFHMILDPGYKSEFQFLQNLVRMFAIRPNFKSTIDYKEALQRHLFQKGVNENKTIVLLIDEGQKITAENLEVLRTLLNYETNDYKLLQLVIMAQTELLPRVKKIHNFMDRVSLKYTINPLDQTETKQMIEFRLSHAGHNSKNSLFSEAAVRRIYEYTQGYPRRIARLCHDCIEALIMKERAMVEENIVEELIAKDCQI